MPGSSHELAESGRGVQSASSSRFRPPRLGILGHGKERTKPGAASPSVAQATRSDVSRRDRSPDGADAAGIGEVDLCVAAVPSMVVHAASGQLGDRDLAHHEPGRTLRSSGARTGKRVRAICSATDCTPAARPRVTGRPPHKGEYFAAGIRGPLTGRRADLVIIDDPIKSQAEADSPVLRERLWNWYRFDLTTRLQATRSDRADHDALARRRSGWPPARAELRRMASVTPSRSGRGERSAATLCRRRAVAGLGGRSRPVAQTRHVGERAWSALFQQSPRPIVGSLFKTDCIDVLDAPPTRSMARSCAPGTLPRPRQPAATIRTGPPV